MRRCGAETRSAGRVYFTGGATAVIHGWRESTIDVDLLLEGGAESLLQSFPAIKEELQINVELASPADFIPELRGWRDRSAFISREGAIDFLHYDYYSQALSKVERSHSMDLLDVREMIGRGLVQEEELRRLFEQIVPELHRYPAIDLKAFRSQLEAILKRA